jgi:dolichol kinase
MNLPGHLVLVLIAADGLAAIVGAKLGRIRLIFGKSL